MIAAQFTLICTCLRRWQSKLFEQLYVFPLPIFEIANLILVNVIFRRTALLKSLVKVGNNFLELMSKMTALFQDISYALWSSHNSEKSEGSTIFP